MRRSLILLAFFLAVLTAVAGTRTARACSAFRCRMGRFIPEAETLPSNLPAFFWVPALGPAQEDAPKPGNLTLTERDSRRTIALTTEVDPGTGDYLIRPQEALRSNVDYELEDSTAIACGPSGHGGPVVTTPKRPFRTTPDAPLPQALGTLLAVRRGIGPLALAASGSCDVCVESERVTVTLEPAPEVTPWLPVLHFSTWVDGKRWLQSKDQRGSTYDGGSWFGRGRDLLHHVCRARGDLSYRGLSAGEHVVVMKAMLPGTELELSTPPVTVRFDCAFEQTDSPLGCTADSGVPDPWAAAALSDDGGSGAQRDGAATPATDAAGQGCSTAAERPSWLSCWLLLAAAGLAFAAAHRQSVRRRPPALGGDA